MISFNDWLLTESGLSKDILAHVELDANTQGIPFSEALEKSHLISEEDYLRCVAKYYNTDFLPAETILKNLDKTLLDKLTPEMVKENSFIPYRMEGQALYIIVSSMYAVRNAEVVASGQISCEYVEPIYTIQADLEALIDKFYTKAVIEDLSITDIEDSGFESDSRYDLSGNVNDSYIGRIISEMITTAIDNNVSDIHIAPEKDDVSIRFRKDGVLFEYSRFKNKALLRRIVIKIKSMSQLKIEQSREIQDGSFSVFYNNIEVNIRVSILPTIHGIEKIVLRVLNKNAVPLKLENMYFIDKKKEEVFVKIIHKPQGIILFTGPTGSGKSTALYTTLNEIASPEINIVTLEDPVEYQIGNYIVQSQYNPDVGMDFPTILKGVLRQDPDVILIGEIRDKETAQIAIEASNTGHLVFSTLHTNSAIGAITRLAEMGVNPFNLADSLLAVMAQRLVRRVCPKCGLLHDYHLNKEEQAMFHTHETVIHGMRASEVGCPVCGYSGYKGRIPIHELLVIDDKTRELLSEGITGQQLRNHVDNVLQMPKMSVDAYEKMKIGLVTLDEIHRVLG